jgi:DUF4097 and DUF4098 domain-containing protein YvlB
VITEQFEVGKNSAVDIRVKSGRVEVTTGPPGIITVEAETGDPKFSVEQAGDRVYVASDRDAGWLSARTANVVVTVPEETDVSIETASAKVECEGRLGDFDAKSASGDITLGHVDSAMVKTASGDVRASRVDRDIKVASASGDARVDHCDRGVFSSASGDIRIDTVTDSINASTASGNLSIGRFVGARASFKSMSGDFSIGIPEGTKLDLDVSLLSGKLNLPKKTSATSPTERQMRIKAKIVSGDLTIKRV